MIFWGFLCVHFILVYLGWHCVFKMYLYYTMYQNFILFYFGINCHCGSISHVVSCTHVLIDNRLLSLVAYCIAVMIICVQVGTTHFYHHQVVSLNQSMHLIDQQVSRLPEVTEEVIDMIAPKYYILSSSYFIGLTGFFRLNILL